MEEKKLSNGSRSVRKANRPVSAILTKTSTIEGEPGMTAKLTAKPAIDSEK